jgi:hypothetical protein
MSSLRSLITEATRSVATKHFKENGWGARHRIAWYAPTAVESPIVELFTALAHYADHHQARFESPIGHDRVLGVGWLMIAKAIRIMLNGDLGRLDGGTLDALLFSMTEAAGFEREELDG